MVSDRLGDEDKWNEIRVLILVVMEYGLGQSSEIAKGSSFLRLNPCCNGIWSRTLIRLFFYYCGFEARGFLFSLQTTQKKCIF